MKINCLAVRFHDWVPGSVIRPGLRRPRGRLDMACHARYPFQHMRHIFYLGTLDAAALDHAAAMFESGSGRTKFPNYKEINA